MTLSEAAARLAEAGVEDPLREARTIFSEIGKIPRYALTDRAFPTDDPRVLDAIKRRSAREPLQYILGCVGFYREEYFVSPDCLIPRPETELLVDYAVEHLPRGARFLDLCTGSGCVALSTLNHTADTRAVAVDLSAGALTVAKKNADALGLSARVTFLLSDAKAPLPTGGEPFFAVLSNPPYVSARAYEDLAPELAYEPKMAFVGGEDGGDFYRAILPLYRDALAPHGFFAFEIGFDQEPLLRSLAKEYRLAIEITPDLAGLPRLAVLSPV